MFGSENPMNKVMATGRLSRLLRWLLPNGGTLLAIALLIATQSVWARGRGGPAVPSISTTTISYQGRLADSDGEPLTGSYDMVFRLYDAPVGGAAVWIESWTGSDAVVAADGLFHVMLGSLNPDLAAVVNTYDELYLGITVGADAEMTPRVQLGSVPFALQAMTVAADSITSVEIADEAVGNSELADNAVSTSKIADDAVTSQKLDLSTGLAVSGTVRLDGSVGINMEPGQHPLHINTQGANGLRLTNPFTGGGDWVIYTGDNGCFGDSLGIGPVVAEGSGQCGGILGTAVVIGTDGSFLATGTKSAVVQTADGLRRLYAVEAPEVRFTDEGLAQLQDGVARIDLDRVFLQTIEGPFVIHVTPYGDTGLYVAEIGQDYVKIILW